MVPELACAGHCNICGGRWGGNVSEDAVFKVDGCMVVYPYTPITYSIRQLLRGALHQSDCGIQRMGICMRDVILRARRPAPRRPGLEFLANLFG
jgi:hypothetical protein